MLPLLLSLVALAQEPDVAPPPPEDAGPAVDPLSLAPAKPMGFLPIAGIPWDVEVTGYVIPPRRVEWLKTEDPVQHCDAWVKMSPDGSTVVTPDEHCSEAWAADAQLFTAHWTFAPQYPSAAEGPTEFKIRYIARYSRELGELNVYATVDPGLDYALAGAQGVPGVKLVHPAQSKKAKDPKLPKHLRGVELEPCYVDLLVDGAGDAHDIEVFECHEDLAELAVKFVSKKWRFTPLIVDGITSPEEIRVEVRFK